MDSTLSTTLSFFISPAASLYTSLLFFYFSLFAKSTKNGTYSVVEMGLHTLRFSSTNPPPPPLLLARASHSKTCARPSWKTQIRFLASVTYFNFLEQSHMLNKYELQFQPYKLNTKIYTMHVLRPVYCFFFLIT